MSLPSYTLSTMYTDLEVTIMFDSLILLYFIHVYIWTAFLLGTFY